MFAIPGIFCIFFVIYLRPHEVYPELQGIPLVSLLFLVTIVGACVDLRLRATKVVSHPTLGWLVGLYLWALVTVAFTNLAELVPRAIELFIIFVIFFLMAQSIQTFRVFERTAIMMVALTCFLTVIAVHQSLADRQCLVAPVAAVDYTGTGVPDGRPCERARECYDLSQGEYGSDYFCEKVGLLGTHAIGGRVRYRGVLQDPNELAAALSGGLALLLALWIRRRTTFWAFVASFGFVSIVWSVVATGSRSGQLGLLASLGTFIVWRYGMKIAAIVGPLCVPVLLFVASGGGGRGDADESSEVRYNAWRAGLDMFRRSPIWGVGFGNYGEHHHLTAHNTYILILGELGIIGLFLFTMIVWLSIKTPLVALRRYSGRPEARVAEVWSAAVLATTVIVLCGGLFLSLSYHYLLWIFLGFSGALFACIRRHDPQFNVPVTGIDIFGVAIIDIVIFVLLQVFLRFKGI